MPGIIISRITIKVSLVFWDGLEAICKDMIDHLCEAHEILVKIQLNEPGGTSGKPQALKYDINPNL